MLHPFDLFFRYITPFYPIIHRSTFEIQFADGLHERNHVHSDLVLMLCAVASIYSNDPRVHHEVNKLRVPGYQYFLHVNHCAHISATHLPGLQTCVLRAIYFDYVSQRHVAWFILGAGIRCAQDIGAHRKSFQGSTKPVEKEMWSWTFWCLVTLDRLVSCAIGQIPAVNGEDLDVTFPSSLPSEDFADLEYFNPLLDLGTLANMVLRTLIPFDPGPGPYSANCPRKHPGPAGLHMDLHHPQALALGSPPGESHSF
ncbi:hypothetical protein BS47DRAFT_193868 [Hydnum rufescens UP504]|uniref:Xylanolytic transcriptional activator regulatory domain-containing protein n=1 Tax=Hydnum rufescens UP504 TaxID=1448309 RepID=A0A9P6B9J7_9AGAM|nr:hypothetical protein BS47DRAFT_193868 [Hydnum rufescens UP504]